MTPRIHTRRPNRAALLLILIPVALVLGYLATKAAGDF